MPETKKRKKKEARTRYRISFNADKEKNTVSVTFSPKLKQSKLEDMHVLLNLMQVGTTLGFRKILAPLPMMRPATDEEMDMQIYIMKDEKKDVALYKQRKVMYENLVREFDNLVEELFGDVRYIDMATKRQEEVAFELEGEEFEDYMMEVQAITQLVRGENDDDRNNDDEPESRGSSGSQVS